MKPFNSKSGSILIISLWIMAILSLLAMGLGFRASLEIRLSRYSLERLKARYLANAGAVKAKDILSKDNNPYDNLYQCGVSFGSEENPEIVFGPELNKLGEGAFSIYYARKKEFELTAEKYYGMMDEERKININIEKTAPGNVAEYRKVLGSLSASLTDDIINAMIDWQDPDSEVTSPGGAEEADYEALERPYRCKNASFESVEELLLIKGMTREIYDKIKDNVTAYSDGKVNINTASIEVLGAVIDDESGSYSALANKVFNTRRGEDGTSGTKDDRFFLNLNDISNKVALEVNESARLASLANYFVFKSNNFVICSHGISGKTTKDIIWIVERVSGKVKYYHEE